MTEADAGSSLPERVPTWRDGLILAREQKALLSDEQLQQYLDDSVVRDLSEIETMPEPLRAWARRALDEARSHAQTRIAEQERRHAS